MSRPRGLGRGLAELIRPADVEGVQPGEAVRDISLAQIEPNPLQPRQDFDPDELAELAASIKAQGLLQPVTVRPAGPGAAGTARYELVTGERRLRATRDLGRTTIRAIVREVDDRQLLELALVENIMRAELNEIELAEGLRELQQRHELSVTELATALGRSRSALSNTLRLLELPAEVRELVRGGKLSAGHARAVLAFPEDQRHQAAHAAIEREWSVRQLEESARASRPGASLGGARDAASTVADGSRVGRGKAAREGRADAPASKAATRRLEQALMEHFGTKVVIDQHGPQGEVRLTYHSADDLARLVSLLLKDADPV